jgi:hypothetical protein
MEAAAAALPGTLEEVVAPDMGISGSAKGAAALPANNQHVIGQVDNTQVQVGMDPCWSEAANERYRKNEMRLSGVDSRLLYGVAAYVDNLCKMMEIEFERELNQCHDIQKSKDDMDKALAAAAAKFHC